MYLKRKIVLTFILTIVFVSVIGLSYAKFMPVVVEGNRNVNTIIGEAISGTSLNPNIVVTYDKGTNYIDTGDLVLTSDPYTQLIKFKINSSYSGNIDLGITISTVRNSLSDNTATYSLYECNEQNYDIVTYNNVSTNCTNVGKTSNNYLPKTGYTEQLHSESSLIMTSPTPKHYVVALNIAATNTTKRYKGVINAIIKDMTILEFTYDGDYIDNRVNGQGTIIFTSSGRLEVTTTKNDVPIKLIGGGAGGAGGNTGGSGTAGTKTTSTGTYTGSYGAAGSGGASINGYGAGGNGASGYSASITGQNGAIILTFN